VEIWLADNDQVRITAAANEIDRLLAEDPLSIGQVRTNLIRFLAEGPLGVYYEVCEADMQVRVRAVFRIPG
jgi:hypothetical protein